MFAESLSFVEMCSFWMGFAVGIVKEVGRFPDLEMGLWEKCIARTGLTLSQNTSIAPTPMFLL